MFAVAEVRTRVLQVLKPNDIFDLVNNCLSDSHLGKIRSGSLDHRQQPVGQHRGEDVDQLTIAIVGPSEPAPYAPHRGRQLEGCAAAQGTVLAGKHRHVMPGVVDRLTATESAGMLAHKPPVLADHDAIRIGMDSFDDADTQNLRWLLRACREQPCCRLAAQQRDELAPPHSITSSASC